MKLNETQLKTILASYKRLDLATRKAVEAGCINPEGPLFDAIWSGFENMLAIMDKDSWISWHIYDNDLGKKGLTVVIDSKEFKVKTTKTLLRIINS